jgi:hypothetical protein
LLYQREESRYIFVRYGMAGILGFEPRMPDSESGALPLGDIPIVIDGMDNREKNVFFKFLFRRDKDIERSSEIPEATVVE